MTAQQLSLLDYAPAQPRQTRHKKNFLKGKIQEQRSPFVVYAIRHPVTLDVVYIGATSDLILRAYGHCYRSRPGSAPGAWVRALFLQGQVPFFEVLVECSTTIEAAAAEADAISTHRPPLNDPEARPYAGPGYHRSRSVSFPCGQVVTQVERMHGPPSTAFSLASSDSPAIRKIKQECQERGISLATLGREVGVSYQHIGQVLASKYSPGLSTTLALSRLFCISDLSEWETRGTP